MCYYQCCSECYEGVGSPVDTCDQGLLRRVLTITRSTTTGVTFRMGLKRPFTIIVK